MSTLTDETLAAIRASDATRPLEHYAQRDRAALLDAYTAGNRNADGHI